MNNHKCSRLILLDRQEIWRLYQTRLWKVVHLSKRTRLQEFTPHDTTNQRFKMLQYDLKAWPRL